MRKKKSSPSARTTQEETHNSPLEEGIRDELDKIHGFYACYLLTSLCPRFKGHTYIGFTVNPRRRIRQHNGEIRSGAFRTKKRRPWEMVFCIYGFPTNISALQFEWAWQHPTESLQVRQAAATFKSFSGVTNKIKLAYTMLNLPAWKSLNVTVNYFSTKYSKHSAACPSLPEHMKVQVLPIEELPCYTKTRESSFQCEDDELGLNDNDENESSESDSGGVKESLTELQFCFTDEFRSFSNGEKSSTGACSGSDSNSSKEDEAYNEDSHGRPKLDEIPRGKFGWSDEFRSSSSGEKSSLGARGGTKRNKEDEACYEDSKKRQKIDKIDEISGEKFGWFDEFRGSSSREKGSPTACGGSKSIKEDEPYNEDSHKRPKLDKIDEISRKKFGWFEEFENEQEFLSISAEYSPISKVRTTSSVFSTISMHIGDRNEENLSEKFDDGKPSYEIEVIDLLSPSPECRIVSGRKKKRVSTAFPVFIDLT